MLHHIFKYSTVSRRLLIKLAASLAGAAEDEAQTKVCDYHFELRVSQPLIPYWLSKQSLSFVTADKFQWGKSC